MCIRDSGKVDKVLNGRFNKKGALFFYFRKNTYVCNIITIPLWPKIKMRKIISFLLLSFVVYALQAQIKDPVKDVYKRQSLNMPESSGNMEPLLWSWRSTKKDRQIQPPVKSKLDVYKRQIET